MGDGGEVDVTGGEGGLVGVIGGESGVGVTVGMQAESRKMRKTNNLKRSIAVHLLFQYGQLCFQFDNSSPERSNLFITFDNRQL